MQPATLQAFAQISCTNLMQLQGSAFSVSGLGPSQEVLSTALILA